MVVASWEAGEEDIGAGIGEVTAGGAEDLLRTDEPVHYDDGFEVRIRTAASYQGCKI